MKVLVVGGAGYIGGAVVDLLKLNRFQVTVYDNLLFETEYLNDVPFVFGDIRDHDILKEQLDRHDAVVWLAALVGDGACAINPELTWTLNTKAVKWMAQNFRGRIIFPSTCSVYGVSKDPDDILDENSPINPLSIYAASKLKAEEYLGDKGLVFRLGTVFGTGGPHSRLRMDLVLNAMTVRGMLEKKLSVFGGDQYRPLIHVRDVALAIIQQLRTENIGIYNLASYNYKILDLAQEIKQELGAGIDLQVTPRMYEDTRNYRVSHEKALQELTFSPNYTTLDGIQEIAKLVTEKRIINWRNYKYHNEGFLTEYGVG
jgi:nucleoside-diphosphate-sugar epimerase